MKPEDQRIAIAKALGWMFFEKIKETKCPDGSPWILHRWISPKGEIHDFLDFETWLPFPDYLNDLNSCHEMVETLDICQRSMWPMHLRRIVVRDAEGKNLENPDTDRLDDTHFYNATTAQRCEAFLKTLGLWKEDA